MITIILHSPFATSHICYSEVNWNLADLRLSNAQNGTLNYWELRWFGFQYKVQTETAIPLPLKAFLSFFFFFFFDWLDKRPLMKLITKSFLISPVFGMYILKPF